MKPDFERIFLAEYCGLAVDGITSDDIRLFYVGKVSSLRAIKAVCDAAYAAGLERAAEIADEYDGAGLESRSMYDQLGDGNKTRLHIVSAIRAEKEKNNEA